MKEIALGGKYCHLLALVDDEDYEMVTAYRWHGFQNKAGNVYARRGWRENGKQRGQFLHSLLTGWRFVDHVNHDGLDNRRCNLRQATALQNAHNARPNQVRGGRPCTSRFKGVSLKGGKRWVAQIVVAGEKSWIGSFNTEIEAALAYDRRAAQHFGEYAYLNFPEGTA